MCKASHQVRLLNTRLQFSEHYHCCILSKMLTLAVTFSRLLPGTEDEVQLKLIGNEAEILLC